VTNNLARQYLRQVRQGDRILYYHTGKEKAVVGEMRASANAGPDPAGGDAKAVAVEVEPVRQLPRPVPLALIKADAALHKWDLVRLPRLSVMPVTAAQWARIEQLSRDPE
jgi:predicted RNA-binding protein with PUA-like domain